MKKSSTRTSSVDGFIPRRAGSQLGDLHEGEAEKPIDRSLHTGENIGRDVIGQARDGKLLGQDEISDSLQGLDSLDGDDKKANKKRDRRDKRAKRPKNKVKRIIFWFFIAVVVALVGVGGYVLWKAINAGTNVFDGNIFDIVQNQPLKEDENGRSNFLVFGTAEDDEGGTHDGPNLTDSIMVISVDQDKKDAYMMSLPRDLWVEYQEPCSVGYQGRINAVYFCGSNGGENEKAGAKALSRKVGEITGLDIQYYVHLNFTAVIDAVDAVGGVDVTIESDDPRGILDRNFDWKCNYNCYYVKYKDGQKVHLDGEHALALARARNVNPGSYGLPRGNFDREKNQQKIIKALQDKAVSAGTLTNLGAVTGLIDALGKNLRTNIETKEIRTLMSLGIDVKPDNIYQLSLVDEDEPLVTTGMYNGQSIVLPISGLLNYSEIVKYVDKNVNSTPMSREEPQVMVLNGGAASGAAQTEATKLEEQGFIVAAIDNVPSGSFKGITIYQIDDKKTASAAKLKEVYGKELITEQPPFSVVGDADFVIVVGASE